jgi:DNA helicase-2/ATP-dependent DNA helicase PcrA
MGASIPLGNQQVAVESDADHLLVLAPPGCGKTEVLAMRADRLIRSGVVRPQRRLLALTFTNRAKDNLNVRLKYQLGEQRVRSSVAVMNFHELGARVVESHFRTIGLAPDLTFSNATWLKKALNDATTDWRSQNTAKELLGSVKRLALDDTEVLARLHAEGNEYAIAVEERRQGEGYVDYGDVLRYAQLILRNDRIAELFQEHFDAVLVDEFQDLSLQQFEIASRVCTKNSTFVGDPYQGIFGWAGAQPTEVHAALLDRVGASVDLDVSFRSSPAVLDVVNVASASLGSTPLHAANPEEWSNGGHAYAVSFESDSSEAAGIVALTDRLAAKHPNDRIGVICRAEYRRKPLERAYVEAMHPPQYWDIALDTPRVVKLLKQHAKHVDASLSFEEQVEELLRRVSQTLRKSDVDTLTEIQSACDQLNELGRSSEKLVDLMSRIRDAQDPSPIQVGVHVLNAHVGKGQQFDWVIVKGLEEGHVPSVYSTTPEQIAEEQRVLLVMLSRACKGLFLTHANRTTNQYGRVFRNGPSRWWAAMAAVCQPTPERISQIMMVNP